MSRTSRRASRPLIAVLAIVIVLGVAFTVHKVRKAHAQVAKSTPRSVATPAPASAVPAAAPKREPAQPAAKPAPAEPIAVASTAGTSAPAPAESPAVDSTALITQTPTEKVSSKGSASPSAGSTEGSDSAPAAPPTTPPSAPSNSSTPAQPLITEANTTPANSAAPASDSNENDAAGLQEWAKGGAKSRGAGTAPESVAIASNGSPAAGAPAQVNLSPESPADAKAKLAAGDLISARQILNDNLIAGRGDAEALKQQIEQINQTLIFSAKKFPDDPWGGSYQVAGGERLGSIANRNGVTWELLARINNVTPKKLRQGQWIKIAKGPFYAVVTKGTFKMDVYLGGTGGPGSMFVRTFGVGLGKDNSTPTGLWMCKAGDKIRNPRYYPSRGGDIIAPDDPKNPLGGYWIAIEGLDGQAVGKESYGIHGTIEPDSIGKMSSQGCIRLRAEDISWVFDLLVDGKSKVLVKD